MKKSEIQVGKTYTNGKKRERKVEKIIYSDGEPQRPYDIIYSKPEKPGVKYGPTLAWTFARWAKAEVKP